MLINTALQILVREEDAAVADQPASCLGELDDGAFAVEEKEVLGRGDGEGWVGCFAACCDFGADVCCEDLWLEMLIFTYLRWRS